MTGELLYKPLRLPTSRPPLPPELRPAYTDVSLKRAIRDGIGPDGSAFSPFMPRYALNDDDLLATPVRQVYRDGDPRGETAAAALRRSLQARGDRSRTSLCAAPTSPIGRSGSRYWAEEGPW